MDPALIYPIVRYPPPGTAAETCIKVDCSHVQKGQFDGILLHELQRDKTIGRYFDTGLALAEGTTRSVFYYPDLVYANVNLKQFIDIEIDEPYTYVNGKPIVTHYLTTNSKGDYVHSDAARDAYFTDRGWTVVRFSSNQVSVQLYSCVAFIKEVITSLASRKPIDYKTLSFTEPQWTEAAAWQMLNSNSRMGTSPNFFKL